MRVNISDIPSILPEPKPEVNLEPIVVVESPKEVQVPERCGVTHMLGECPECRYMMKMASIARKRGRL